MENKIENKTENKIKNKFLTITNIIVMVSIILFIIDRYILFDKTEILDTSSNIETGSIIAILLGIIPGKLTEIFGYIVINNQVNLNYTIFTHIFLHTFLFHLIFNMLALYKVGNIVEKKYGKISTFMMFIFSGPIVTLISNFIVKSSDSLTIGASGSIFALIGMSVVCSFLNKNFTKENYKKRWIIFFIIYGVLITITNSWTFVAHTTGFIIGIIYGFIYFKVIKKGKQEKKNKIKEEIMK